MQLSTDDVKNFLKQITPNKDWLYIIQPCSIGDFLYTGGLAHAIQKKKNKSATVLIVKERMKNLGITYENFADIIYLDENTMNIIMHYCFATSDYEGDNYIYGHFHRTQGGGYEWNETLHLIDRYKENVFGIPLNTPYAKPVVPPISDENIATLHKNYFLDKQRTIILAPYTHSTKQLDMCVWEFLALILKQKNYVVYTNVGISENPINGTMPITTNFRELYYIADKVKCFIGSRVGIFDFLAITRAKNLVIDVLPHWFWGMKALYPDSDSLTFYNAINYLEQVLGYFYASGFTAQIKLSHPRIRDEDIYYSYEELLNGILNEVEKI